MKIDRKTLLQIIKEELSAYLALGGITPTDDQNIIKKAYRKQAMKTHPDRGGNKSDFQDVQAAYETLSDQEKKRRHDKELLDSALRYRETRPDANYDGETGMELSDENIEALKRLAGIPQDSQQNSNTSQQNSNTSQQNSNTSQQNNSGTPDMEQLKREWEKKQQFFDLKEKIYDAVSKKAMEMINQNQFDYAQNFMQIMKQITAAKTVEDLRDYMGFIQ